MRSVWEYIDKNGNVLLSVKYYNFVSGFSDGLALVSNYDLSGKTYQKYGFINKSGELVIPLIYEYAESFENGLSVVGINKKYGIIDNTGKEVIPLIYDSLDIIKDKNLIIATKDGKSGILNEKGEIVLPFEYDNIVRWVRDNLISVSKDGLWGILEIKR